MKHKMRLKIFILKIYESIKMGRISRKKGKKTGNMKKRLYGEITVKKIRSKTSDQATAKTFRLDKLDQIAEQTKPKARRRPVRIKIDDDGGIDYAPEVDPYEDMDVEGLMIEGYVAPQTEKQIAKVPSKAPKYEMDPSFLQIPSEPPLPYEDVEPLAIKGPGEEEIDEGDDDRDEESRRHCLSLRY